MRNKSLYLPGFRPQNLRKISKPARQAIADKIAAIKQKSLCQLSQYFDKFLPANALQAPATGAMSRNRLFSKVTTFWAFFSQVLDADGGCKEVVRKLQASAARKSLTAPSSSTAAYCKARQRLDSAELADIFRHTSYTTETQNQFQNLNNRRVIVVDGTGLSMPDTLENQHRWPQQKHQTPGCGFPQAMVCACFCLRTGMLLSYELGNKKSSELPMLRRQWKTFKEEDIFLGDKGFCSYYDLAGLRQRKVDSVVSLARRKPVSAGDAVKVLGDGDLLIQWKRPKWSKSGSHSKAQWQALPETLLLRQIKVTVTQPGFRSKDFHIITTLLDADTYPASDIADLYLQRWDVELFFRDIKTTMGMDILRCKTPVMVEKEILMHFIAYNCLRRLMLESMGGLASQVRKLSFKGCLQALRQWLPQLGQPNLGPKKLAELIELLLEKIEACKVASRPGRREPRAVKRRQKPFQQLNRPRNEMHEIPHRSKYRAAA